LYYIFLVSAINKPYKFLISNGLYSLIILGVAWDSTCYRMRDWDWCGMVFPFMYTVCIVGYCGWWKTILQKMQGMQKHCSEVNMPLFTWNIATQIIKLLITNIINQSIIGSSCMSSSWMILARQHLFSLIVLSPSSLEGMSRTWSQILTRLLSYS